MFLGLDVTGWTAILALATVLLAGGTVWLAVTDRRRDDRKRQQDRERDDRLRAEALKEAEGRERRQQAERISGWPGQGSLPTTPLILLNRSDEPVYEVVATLVLIQGGGARRGEDYIPSGYRRVISILPPGRWRVNVDGGWAGMSRRPGVEVAFTDRAGITWIRRAAGMLEEVKMPAIDHYGLDRPQELVVPISDETSPPALPASPQVPPASLPAPAAPSRTQIWRSRFRKQLASTASLPAWSRCPWVTGPRLVRRSADIGTISLGTGLSRLADHCICRSRAVCLARG